MLQTWSELKRLWNQTRKISILHASQNMWDKSWQWRHTRNLYIIEEIWLFYSSETEVCYTQQFLFYLPTFLSIYLFILVFPNFGALWYSERTHEKEKVCIAHKHYRAGSLQGVMMWKHSRKISWRILQTTRKLGQAKLAGKCILLYPPLQISLLGPLGEWHQNSSCPAYLPESLQQISYNMLLSKM